MASHDQTFALKPINVDLDGTNYLYWAKTMTSVLKGMLLWGIVDFGSLKPIVVGTVTQADVDRWEQKNHFVISLIRINCVRVIAMTISETDSAKEVWDTLKATYLQKNTARRFQLEQDIREIRQGPSEGISELLARLNIKWEEYYLTLPSTLLANAEFKEYIEENKLFQFLYALSDDFESIRSSLLHRSPLPNIKAIIPDLISEQTRKQRPVDSNLESALGTTTRSNDNKTSSGRSLYCTYCRKTGHLKKDCLRLQRKNQSSPSGTSRAAATSSSPLPTPPPSDAPITLSQLQDIVQGIVENAVSQIIPTGGNSIAASATRSGSAHEYAMWEGA